MPPKRAAADSAPSEGTAEKKSDAAAPRRLAAHPSTAVMVKEALQALDSRKGVSSQAIQNYIKQKYTTVDLVRLKRLVRNSLKKGLENGTLVRPANSTITTGAVGKFRLAPKVKESKPKSENADPNVEAAPKAKNGDKKLQKAGTTKNPETGEKKRVKAPKLSKKAEEAAPSKVPPAKKPKSKTDAEGGDEGRSAKSVKMKTPKSQAAETGSDAPAAKATGKRGKRPVM